MILVTTALAVAACLLTGSICWARGHTAGYREGRTAGYSTGFRRGHLRGQADAHTSMERIAGTEDHRPGLPWTAWLATSIRAPSAA